MQQSLAALLASIVPLEAKSAQLLPDVAKSPVVTTIGSFVVGAGAVSAGVGVVSAGAAGAAGAVSAGAAGAVGAVGAAGAGAQAINNASAATASISAILMLCTSYDAGVVLVGNYLKVAAYCADREREGIDGRNGRIKGH